MEAVNPKHLFVGGKWLTIQQQLGNGAFGEVNRVKADRTSAVYALKDIPCENVSAIDNALHEVNTLEQYSHDNIVSIMGASRSQDEQTVHVLILMEYCSGGNLNKRLTQVSDEEENAKWMSQTAEALAYLHRHGIVHRDLKPENVLLSDPINQDVKLSDFGLARQYVALTHRDIDDDDADSWLTMYTVYHMDSFVGTPYWLAPECFNGHYTKKADVFSLGVICFAILERDYVLVEGKKFYGAFVKPPEGAKIGLGYAMAYLGDRVEATFSPWTHGSNALRRIVLDALQCEARHRPNAEDVHQRIVTVRESTKLRFATETLHRGCPGGCQ